MVVVAEIALEMIVASVAQIANMSKRTIILRRGNAPLCVYRRPRLGGKTLLLSRRTPTSHSYRRSGTPGFFRASHRCISAREMS